jgi:hypothetical protein
MGGYVYKAGQVERVTITPQQLEQIARVLGITAPEQVQGISISITGQPPRARPSATRRSTRQQE